MAEDSIILELEKASSDVKLSEETYTRAAKNEEAARKETLAAAERLKQSMAEQKNAREKALQRVDMLLKENKEEMEQTKEEIQRLLSKERELCFKGQKLASLRQSISKDLEASSEKRKTVDFQTGGTKQNAMS